MHTPFAVIALSTCLLALAACDKTPPTPPAPVVQAPVPTDAGTSTGSAAQTTVPSAESVFSPASVAKAASTAERSNSALSSAQESTAMPMAGQNNDHSAPLGPAKGASAP